MPAFGVYKAVDEYTAGDEVSSTYEGRHVTVLESDLIHPVVGLVVKGDPVVFGTTGLKGVGVAFLSAAAVGNLIPIDTEGIWGLSVVAEDDAGNSAVAGGDRLYINTTTAVISKITNIGTQIPFGIALGIVGTGVTGVIAVKVHQDPNELETVYGAKTFNGAVTMDSTLNVTGAATISGTLNALEHFAVGYDATIGRDLSVLQHFSVAYNAIVGNNLTVNGHGNVANNLIVGNDLTVNGHLGAVRAHVGNGATFTGVVTNLTVEDGIVTAAS